ncbi:hypothetical protein F383_22099 [Gossypium arboreum]|uniref:Uncharacterized protein n=1 Tax=Gossypium arboreum TaxID=29729 RepID=A0A0B0MLZ5_GOSAR|nr:hypothetical protein F383_22099 [Gossypium arboreum]
MILVNRIPLLDTDLVGPSSSLGRDQLLKISDRVVVVALHAHLLP